MEKYNLLKSDNSYINFTLQNYLNCYNDLTIEDIPRFTQLFDLLKNHNLKLGSHLIDNRSVQGIKLNSTDEKNIVRSTKDLSSQLSIISEQLNSEDKTSILFFQSVTHLCDSIQFLKTEEMMDLNYLFQTVSNFKQSISDDVIKDGKTFFYPYNRYTKIKK